MPLKSNTTLAEIFLPCSQTALLMLKLPSFLNWSRCYQCYFDIKVYLQKYGYLIVHRDVFKANEEIHETPVFHQKYFINCWLCINNWVKCCRATILEILVVRNSKKQILYYGTNIWHLQIYLWLNILWSNI